MAHFKATGRRTTKSAGVLTAFTLARWRVRTTWPLLLMCEIGLITAIVLMCIVPLCTTVNTTAGLRDILRTSPSAPLIHVKPRLSALSTRLLHDVQQRIAPVVQQDLGLYLSPAAPWSISVDGVIPSAPLHLVPGDDLTISGMSLDQAHLTLLKGRLASPTLTDNTLEIMITDQTASLLHLQLDSTMPLHVKFYNQNPGSVNNLDVVDQALPARVVGIFAPPGIHDPFWLGNTFQPQTLEHGTAYRFLLSNTALLAAMDQMAQAAHTSAVFLPADSIAIENLYSLDVTRFTIDDLNDLSNREDLLQSHLTALLKETPTAGYTGEQVYAYPYVQGLSLVGDTIPTDSDPGTLAHYRDGLAVARIPVTVLALQIIALILLFIVFITDLLIDWQAEAIAVLRSRGASGSQIFAMLLTQGIALSLIALVIGPPLAVLLTYLITTYTLGISPQDTLVALSKYPWQTLTTIYQYAGATALAAVIAISISLLRATHLDTLNTRREAARSQRRPLWQRLNLDIVAGVLAFVGYLLSVYVSTADTLLDVRSQTLVASPLALVAPLFLLIGCLLLFMRLFPLLLRAGSWLALRSRGAISMLALAQMARAPRHTLRVTLLLALASAFSIFTLIFTASQNQQSIALASYETGADFSGTLTSSKVSTLSLAEITQHYQAIAGVASATIGLSISGSASATVPALPVEVRAVDSSTFAHTAIWPQTASTQSLVSLMALLSPRQGESAQNAALPVIIDDLAALRLNLHIGSTFNVDINSLRYGRLPCLVIAQIRHIPTINDSLSTSNDPDTASPAGVLLDFQSYANYYHAALQNSNLASTTLAPNYVWLRAQGGQVASVRSALSTSPDLSLDRLIDRQALTESLQTNPLYLNLLSILTIGTTTALFLALIGGLLASWLNAHTRQTSFAILRALGTTPQQVARMLTWEQAIVYATALLLGLGFGALFAATALPALLFSATSGSGQLASLSITQFYALQHILPTPLIVPPSVSLMLIALILLCAITLWIMIRVVARPSLSEALRINQD